MLRTIFKSDCGNIKIINLECDGALFVQNLELFWILLRLLWCFVISKHTLRAILNGLKA